MGRKSMSARQCEIAAESYTASLLARAGFDVLVQYGANQPDYDLVAEKDGRFLPISVKGSQDGGWMLAVRYVKPGVNYLEAIQAWLAAQRDDIVFFLVQFVNVGIDESPRVYVARPPEMASYMSSQRYGQGHGSLQEDFRRDHPKSKYNHTMPTEWRFSESRIDRILQEHGSVRSKPSRPE